MGGTSSEREVSLKSGENIYNALKVKNYNVSRYDFTGNLKELLSLKFDIAFNIIHGGEGEDGKLSGIFEMLHKKYIGSSKTVQAITLEKHFCQPLIASFGLNIPHYITIYKNEKYEKKLKSFMLDFKKIVIKPSSEGSSVGIMITENYDEAIKHIRNEHKKHNVILCEEYIKGIELTVGMINRGKDMQIFTPLEIHAKREFYNYEAKYTPGGTDFIIPPRIPDKFIELVKKEGNIIFKMFGIRDFARADCILFHEKLYWHDVNTVPGMTLLSDLPQMAKYHGIEFDDLVEQILLGALANE